MIKLKKYTDDQFSTSHKYAFRILVLHGKLVKLEKTLNESTYETKSLKKDIDKVYKMYLSSGLSITNYGEAQFEVILEMLDANDLKELNRIYNGDY